jgi:hypothetical protein
VTFTADQLATLKGRVNQFVLDTLKSQEFDPTSVDVEPPLFRLLIENFPMTPQRREPTGAAFQGLVFGFLRADNPHLQIEIDKVRTGSKRLQRIGDVDGWEGARLAISAEVKQFTLKATDVTGLSDLANATGRRGALGIVTALGFEDDVRLLRPSASFRLIPTTSCALSNCGTRSNSAPQFRHSCTTPATSRKIRRSVAGLTSSLRPPRRSGLPPVKANRAPSRKVRFFQKADLTTLAGRRRGPC